MVRPGYLIFAALVALWVALRWRRSGVELRAVGIAVAAGLAVYGSGAVEFPDVEQLIEDLGRTLGDWTYLLVGVMAFLETGAFVGLVAPGEFTVILGGVIAGQGEVSVVLLLALVWACAVSGDSVSFYLGRRLGRGFLIRHGPRFKITEPRLRRVERFFADHGGATILIGRFIGVVRALAPFVAGASKMRFGRFLPFDVIGAGLWATTFVLLGFFFWQNFHTVTDIAGRGAFVVGTIVFTIAGAVLAVRYLRFAENRARLRAWIEARTGEPLLGPLLRAALGAWDRALVPAWKRWGAPAARRLAAPARFVRDRLTPGELGLEVTTLGAVGGVGAFVYAGLASEIGDGAAPRFDGSGIDLADSLRSDLLDSLAEVVTTLGALPVTGGLVLVTAVALAARRRLTESLTLIAGMALTAIAVQVAKAAEDRSRPPDPLVETDSASFPSGHAAYSIALVAVAVALWRAYPSWVHRAGLVIGAIVLAAAVGLSRVYLRAHWLSDVFGGWGLAAAIFCACGIAGLFVAHIRNNAARP